MACMPMRAESLELRQQRAIDDLRERLKLPASNPRSVRVRVDRFSRSVAFDGWSDADRGGLCDGCVVQFLQAAGSIELRQAMVRAEAVEQSGARVQFNAGGGFGSGGFGS